MLLEPFLLFTVHYSSSSFGFLCCRCVRVVEQSCGGFLLTYNPTAAFTPPPATDTDTDAIVQLYVHSPASSSSSTTIDVLFFKHCTRALTHIHTFKRKRSFLPFPYHFFCARWSCASPDERTYHHTRIQYLLKLILPFGFVRSSDPICVPMPKLILTRSIVYYRITYFNPTEPCLSSSLQVFR